MSNKRDVSSSGRTGILDEVLALVSAGSFFLPMAACLVLPALAAEPYALSSEIKPHYDGRLRVDYDYRVQGDAKDSDIYAYWYGRGRDLWNGRVDFYTSGRLHTDLDAPSSTSLADDMYLSLDDYSSVIEDRVQQLYVDIHDRNGQMRVRAGRQYVDIADYLPLDGAQVMLFENGKFGGRIYAGSPYSFYSSISGDYAAGLSLVGRPWNGNRTRFTYAQYHDDSEKGDDHDYFFDVRQEITDAARTSGQLSILNDEFRMARLDFYFFPPDGRTDVFFGGSRWGSFDARTRAYSPLYSVLSEQEPYTYAYVRLTHRILPTLVVSPGVSIRTADGGDDNFSNASYGDYNVSLTFEPTRAFSSSLSVEYWDVKYGDKFVGVSGEIRYRRPKRWEISLGTGYVDYNYSAYSDISYSINGGQTVISEGGTVIEESPYVYTYFLRTKLYITRKLVLRLQGDIEDNSEEPDMSFRGRGSIEVRF